MSDWFDAGGSGSAVDVQATLDGVGVAEAISELVQLGALVSLGTTSDGGALGVTLSLDDRRRKVWVRQADDLIDWLAEALPAVRALSKDRAASASNERRSRRR